MQPLRKQAIAGRERLENDINLTVAQTQAYSDQIQKRAKAQPELTALCDFTATMQIRRLRTVPPLTWTPLESRWCTQMVNRLADLKKNKSPAATLALACLGYERKGLDKALKALDLQAEQEAPSPPPSPPPAESLAEPMAEPGEAEAELDPETEAMLAELKKQASLQAGVKK